VRSDRVPAYVAVLDLHVDAAVESIGTHLSCVLATVLAVARPLRRVDKNGQQGTVHCSPVLITLHATGQVRGVLFAGRRQWIWLATCCPNLRALCRDR
jgi:hypothetical protein